MKQLLEKQKYNLVLALVVIVCSFIVNPLGEFPLNDDWSYTWSVLWLAEKGYIHIGDWPSMTLVTHICWGFIFVKIFGVSFLTLRVSTLVSALIGLVVLNNLVTKLTGNRVVGIVAALTLWFNPIFFNVGYTFMTDVNFNTLLILCCYFVFRFFEARKWTDLLIVFILSVAITLLRQFGIIVPVCFMVACLFMDGRRWPWVTLTALACLGVWLVLYRYEGYLRGILPKDSGYKFSEGIQPLGWEFSGHIHRSIPWRYRSILVFVLFYCFPFVAIQLSGLIKQSGYRRSFLILVGCCGMTFLIFRQTNVLMWNVFTNMSLGPETFYESFNTGDGHPHTFSPAFDRLVHALKYVFVPLTLLLLALRAIRLYGQKQFISCEGIFVALLFVAYLSLIFIAGSHFDRYHVPLLTLTLILMARGLPIGNPRYLTGFVVLLVFAYVSVAGTRDYFTLNRVRWNAYHDLQSTGVKNYKVNGGFEVNCWNEGQIKYASFLDLKGFDYLIQYRPEAGFVPYRSYEFQRYFPYKKDKINIFARQVKIKDSL